MKKKQLQWAINPFTGQMMFREIEQDDKDRNKKRVIKNKNKGTMKILTREQFLEMPKGTVFRKVSLDHDKAGVLYMLDAEDNPLKILDDKPWVVDEDEGTIDYFYITLGCTMLPKGEQIDDNEAFLRMREGEQIDYTHIGERDGLFENDDIGFAVYTEAEVSEMIERLKCSLEVLKCGGNRHN